MTDPENMAQLQTMVMMSTVANPTKYLHNKDGQSDDKNCKQHEVNTNLSRTGETRWLKNNDYYQYGDDI